MEINSSSPYSTGLRPNRQNRPSEAGGDESAKRRHARGVETPSPQPPSRPLVPGRNPGPNEARFKQQDAGQNRFLPTTVTREFVSPPAQRAIAAYRSTMEQQKREEIASMLGIDAYA